MKGQENLSFKYVRGPFIQIQILELFEKMPLLALL